MLTQSFSSGRLQSLHFDSRGPSTVIICLEIHDLSQSSAIQMLRDDDDDDGDDDT